jgi:hypothetical protein
MTAPAVSGGYKLDREAGQKCRAHCEALDMRLAAVAIVMNSSGCVCEPKDRPAGASENAVTAGGAALDAMLQGQRAQEQAAQHKVSPAYR